MWSVSTLASKIELIWRLQKLYQEESGGLEVRDQTGIWFDLVRLRFRELTRQENIIRDRFDGSLYEKDLLDQDKLACQKKGFKFQ
jgi:hypothetical protein